MPGACSDRVSQTHGPSSSQESVGPNLNACVLSRHAPLDGGLLQQAHQLLRQALAPVLGRHLHRAGRGKGSRQALLSVNTRSAAAFNAKGQTRAVTAVT